jgi:hypothetical protein
MGLNTVALEGFGAVEEALLAGRISCDAGTAAAWMELCLRAKHTREAHRVAELLATKPGGRDAGRYWSAYLGLLLEDNLLEDKDAARDLLRAAPDESRYQALFAFAQLRTGQRSAALDSVRGGVEKGAVDALLREERIMLAAVCAANGLTAAAERLDASVPADTLLPEERALLGRDA